MRVVFDVWKEAYKKEVLALDELKNEIVGGV